VLGAELIQGGRAGYRLAAGPGVVVDLDVAAGFCEQAEGKLGTAAAVALAAAERAHELLSAGTAIGEEHYADWADPARDQVRELLRRVRLAAAEAALATGDPRRAAGYAEAAVAADPLDEAAHRWYMSAGAAAGEQGKALAAYEALRQRLGRELGADPAPQTRELHLAILREQDGGLARSGSARSGSARPGPHPGPMPGAIRLTGRDRESKVLRETSAAGPEPKTS
jgi:DNA-binding SARP family transcriptional activator